jgi:hypothetical protein
VDSRKTAYWLVAALIGILVCPSLLVGLPPHSADHNLHLASAVETERLLRTGRVVGWSDFQFAGHLANGFYPPLPALLVASLHWLTQASLNWDATYSIVLLIFLMTLSLSICALARPIVGDWAALVAAFTALLVDRGSWLTPWGGGWYFYIYLGVWPFMLSVALVFAALALLREALLDRSPARLWGFGVLTTFAILAHPFALVLLPALASLQLLVWRTMRRVQSRALLSVLAFYGLGLALAAWWWVPFLMRRSQMEMFPLPPQPARQLLSIVKTGIATDRIIWWVLPGALLGSWLAWQKREPWSRWCVLASWGLWFASTELPYLPFGLDLRHGWVANLQLVRFQIPARLLLIILASGGVFWLARLVWRRMTRIVLICGAIAISSVGIMLWIKPTTFRLPRSGAPHRPSCYTKTEESQLREILLLAKERTGTGRLALYSSDPNRHCLALSASLIEVPFFKIGVTPANQFGGKFSTEDPALLADIGATALLTDEALPPALSVLPLLARLGSFQVRAIDPRPRVRATHPEARVTIPHWSDEDIRLLVDTPEQTRLQLFVDFSPEWQASQAGGMLETEVYPLGGARFLQVRAGSGELKFQFRALPSTRASNAISTIALAALLGFVGTQLIRAKRRSYFKV